MSLAHFTTGAFLIVFLMGAAWTAPTTPSSGSQQKNERDSQTNNGQLPIKSTTNSNRNESAATTLGVELRTEFPEEAKCQSDWQKFLADFGVHYASDTETQKRRNIFCANWRRIQEHNAQFEEGKESFKKKINQWSDLTFQEWKESQEPSFPPNMKQAGSKPESTEVDQKRIKCQAAWEKFLTDYKRKYENDAETEKRWEIFCKNWQRIQAHNALYESGKVSSSKRINQWSDLTFEEWKTTQESSFPPNMEQAGNQTDVKKVQKFPSRNLYTIQANMDDLGTFVAETTMKPNLINTNLTKEVPQIGETKSITSETEPANTEVPEHKIDASEIDQECQAAWEMFLSKYNRKYESDAETEKRRSIFCDNWRRIQEHNADYELKKVSYKKAINEWSDLTFDELKNKTPYTFPPNMEEPGTYVAETTLKPELGNTKLTEEVPQIEELQEPANTEVSEHKTDASEDDLKCQAAWEKFLTDYKRKYENYAETEKRRETFCKNWQRIQAHNALYESRKVSSNKRINEWSDLTLEEKNKTPYTFPPNMEEPGTYVAETTLKPELVNTKLTEEVPPIKEFEKPANREERGNKTDGFKIEQNCQAAWEKFLSDYSPKYVNDAETEKRQSIFCGNWQRIQEYNKEHKSGKESINEWSDLTAEELKSQSPAIYPPNEELLKSKTDSPVVQVGAQQYWGLINTEEPGIYVEDTTIKPKLVNIKSTEENLQNIKLKDAAITDVLANKADVSEVDPKCQSAWEKFLTDYKPKYINDDETVKRRSIFCENWRKIQEDNVLYELGKVSNKRSIDEWSDLSIEELKIVKPDTYSPHTEAESKTDSTVVQVGAQAYWGLINMEAPGTYVKETTIKPKLGSEQLPVEAPDHPEELEEEASTEEVAQTIGGRVPEVLESI